ncbi:MAG: DUF799 family lipoprotein [Proteobacteria bacterium]|nr:DUF799 family lipoprotein [Pseudomonadota bacterium]
MLLLLVIVAGWLGGCGGGVHRVKWRGQPNLSNPVYTVAVLPMYNVTNDVEGPQLVRELMAERVEQGYYRTVPLDTLDKELLEKTGITLGSQLELISPKKLGEILRVDGLLYGYLLDFEDVTTGLVNVKRVRAGFRLVETATGKTIWTEGLGVKSLFAAVGVAAVSLPFVVNEGADSVPFSAIEGLSEIPGISEWHLTRVIATEKPEGAAALYLGEKLVTHAFGVHLRLEAVDMVNRIVRTLPSGPGRVLEVEDRDGNGTGQ